MSGARRVLAAGALGAALAPLLAGCGIRTTSVPVDAGPAPSRVTCARPSAPPTPAPDGATRQVYLVCSDQIAPVQRVVQLPDKPAAGSVRAALARELIGLLQANPRTAESVAGYYTAVPGTLGLIAPRPGDPAQALRLNEDVDELPSFALGQIVCTLAADDVLSPGHSVVLGGPGSRDALRRYTCTPDLRSRADAADDAGVPVS